MLQENALTTVSNFKLRNGVSGSGDDSLIEMLINAASDWIEGQTGRKLKARNYNGGTSTHAITGVSDEDYIYFDGYTMDRGGQTVVDENGCGAFHLPQYPILNNADALPFVLAVLTDREAGTWDTTAYTDNVDYYVDRKNGILRLLGGVFESGRRNYRITCTAGFQTGDNQPFVPSNLEELCLYVTSKFYKSDTNLQSESIGTWSRTFNTNKDDPYVAASLTAYSRFSF